MREFIRLLFLFILHNLAQCSIPSKPNLEVRPMDNKVIQRKRMDTLEMCRIFENERLKQMRGIVTPKARSKREIPGPKFGGIRTLRDEDVQKVESIVDKLYDDLSERGQKVTYRQRKVSTTTSPPPQKINEVLFNNSGRRFDFAPAFIVGPDAPNDGFVIPETVPIPWIKKWKHGIIPYFIDPKTYDNGLAEVIMAAFDYFERATCIRLQRLREKPQDKKSMEKVEWIYITNPTGIRQCVHSNERIPNIGVQMVVFGYDCMSRGEIVHEVMHVLGYSHEHNRPDRDQHVTIMWDNIKLGYKKYFEQRKEDPLLRIPYDYNSVLHYPARAFSKNGKVTVLAKNHHKMGQRDGLSEHDVEKVAMIFGQECVDRNKEYLLTTCPSVVKHRPKSKVATQHEIQHYFKDRVWQYGIVAYKLKDLMEFTAEEKENIRAVIKHIEKETCIEFHDTSEPDEESNEESDKDSKEKDEDKDKDKNKDADTGGDNIVSVPEPLPEIIVQLPMNSEKLIDEKNEMEGKSNIVTATEAVAEEDNNISTDAPEADDATETSPSTSPNAEESSTPDRRRNAQTTKSSAKVVKSKARRKRSLKRNTRRHATSTITFVRSAKPGCTCPKPGKPEDEESVIELNADCFNSVNDLLHVFVHILGLDHQHNMHDRDDFLHIVWDKLTPGHGSSTKTVHGLGTANQNAVSEHATLSELAPSFKNKMNDISALLEVKQEMQVKLPAEAALGYPYDYQSVMHYPWLQIKDGVTNIMYPIWNDGWAMGHWQGLSATDVQKLGLLYYEQCLERKKEEEQEEENDNEK